MAQVVMYGVHMTLSPGRLSTLDGTKLPVPSPRLRQHIYYKLPIDLWPEVFRETLKAKMQP